MFFPLQNVFGSCIIHSLYTGCAKIKKKIGAKKLKKYSLPQNLGTGFRKIWQIS